MANNGCSNLNSYSPYCQGNHEQEGRGQYNDKFRNTGASQANTYQPLSANSLYHQPQSSAPASSTVSANGNQDYGNYNDRGSSSTHDTRANYGSDTRQTDTSALGNLASASTLGQNGTSMSTNTYNRNPTYGTSTSYNSNSNSPVSYGTSHQQNDSRDAAATTATTTSAYGSRSQATTTASSHPPHSSKSGHQDQQRNSGSTWQTHAQYIATNSRSSDQNRASQVMSQSSNQPLRPPSGQAVQRPSSRTNAQAVQSPTTPAVPALSQRRDTGSIIQHGAQRVQSPQRPMNRNTDTPTGFTAGNALTTLQQNQSSRPSGKQQSPTNGSFSPSVQASTRPPAPTDGQAGSGSKESTPTVTQYSTTVDPSQVFNDVEYQRRQAEAQTTRDKAAGKTQPKAKSVDEQSGQESAIQKAQNSTETPKAKSSFSQDSDTVKKIQMELEMKQMIEKMRDYKTKEPSLFSEIWEQVKKGQPPQRTPYVAVPSGSAASSPIVANGQIPSPSVQLPPEFELPAADSIFPPKFDRGRYPAQRRRREPGVPKKFLNSHHKKKPAESQPISTESTPVPTGDTRAQPQSGNQSMRQPAAGADVSSGSPMPVTNPHKAPIVPMTGPTFDPEPTYTRKVPVQPPKSGGTYWPENKKRALAEAAKEALTTAPANAGKAITVDEIHDLLNQNPSYTQMCSILESKGFTVDRGQFARKLLKAVPDLGNPSSTTTPSATPLQPSSTPGPYRIPPPPYFAPIPRPNGYFTPYTPQSAPVYPHPGQKNRFYNPSLVQVGRPFTGTATGASVTPMQTNAASADIADVKKCVRFDDQRNLTMNAPSPNISTKEAMAKKRSFSDVVNLQVLSEDEDEPPPQRPRIETSHAAPPPSGLATIGPDQSSRKCLDTITQENITSGMAAPPMVKENRTALDQFKYNAIGGELLRSHEIVRPMNKRQDALRRSTYDARSIARDILVSMGKHPTMRPLNAHLEPLRERFSAVDYNSDLNTFRWDLVDPGGETVPTNAEDGHDSDAEETGTGPRHRQRPQISINVGEGEQGSMAIHPGPSPTFAKNAMHAGQGTPPKSRQETASRFAQSSDDFAQFVSNYRPSMENSFIGAQARTPVSNGGTGVRSTSTKSNQTPSSGEVRKRIGRPPGARNKAPRPDKENPKPSKDPARRSFGTSEDSAHTSGGGDTSVPTRLHVSSTLARPSGLRNAITPSTPSGFAVVIPSRSPSVVSTPHSTSQNASQFGSAPQSKRGRPKKGPPVISDRHPSKPSYKVYKCQWDKCPAELHNLETLRKHVRKHRAQYGDGPYPCLWAGCSRMLEEGSKSLESVVCRTTDEWDKHISKKHINAIAWELGDGPYAHISDYDTESDSHSRQVTPRLSLGRRASPASGFPAPMNLPQPEPEQEQQSVLKVVLPPPTPT